MCFKIKKRAPRWKNRTVYKILKLSGEYLASPYWPKSEHGWERDSLVEIHDRATTERDGLAVQGIYVYKTYSGAQAALQCYIAPRQYVVVALRVSPKDFLHQSDNQKNVATYRRVKVARRQPEVEFYD